MEAEPYLHPKTDAEEGVPFKPLTTMVNYFLENIAQPNYLTDYELHLGKNFSDPKQFEDSFSNDKSHWGMYTLGFIIFLVIGVLVAVIMLILGPIIVFCLVRGIGPFRRVLTLTPSTLSRSSWIILAIEVGVLTVLMLLVIVPMFAMSIWIRKHSENTLFVKVTNAINTLSDFLAKTAEELRATALGNIETAKTDAFKTLDVIPHFALLAYDSSTENQTNKNVQRLHKLGTQELPKLEANLEEVMSMINASKIHERVEGAERPPPQSPVAQRPEIAQKLVTLLKVVKMATTNDSKNVSASKPLAQQMSEADAQLQAIKNNMSKSVDNPVADIKGKMDETATKINEFVDTASSISFTSLIDKICNLCNSVKPAIDGVFAFLVIIFLMLLAITLLQLTAFVLYFPYWLPKYKFSARNRTIKAGKTLFRVVVYMILLTAWLYWIIAAVSMYLAGQVHTEVCRHLTDPLGHRSRRVIVILDAYLTSKLFDNPRQRFSILETYAQCEKDLPIYKAGNVQTLWNFDDMFDLSELRKATDRLDNVNVFTGHPPLLSSELKAMMLRLEDLHNKTDIAGMSHRVNTSALPHASMPDTRTNRSNSPNQSLPNIHEHNKKLAGKLHQIAYNMASFDFGNLSRGLEENQNIFRTSGEEITRIVVRKFSTEVYNSFAGAVQRIKRDIERNIGHCRSLYVSAKLALEEPCIQILYPINGYWFCLGMANIILIPIFITSYKLSDFLDSFKSQDELPTSNTTAEKPQEKMAKENPNLDQPKASSKPRKSSSKPLKSNRVAPHK